MKTNLRDDYWIEGFESLIEKDNFCWDKKSNIKIIYSGKTSEIPEKIIRFYLYGRNIAEKMFYKNYLQGASITADLKESIQSAITKPDGSICEYCIIYKV